MALFVAVAQAHQSCKRWGASSAWAFAVARLFVRRFTSDAEAASLSCKALTFLWAEKNAYEYEYIARRQ